MKKIYIAKDYKEIPLAVVLSEDRNLASAFFLGQGLSPHSIEEIDVEKIDKNIPVAILFTSDVVNSYDLDVGESVRTFKRGM